MPDDTVIARMQSLIDQWQEVCDHRSIFLNCYCMMTRNMLSAVDHGEFHDSAWVDRLLRHFADYYFIALNAYEQDPDSAPTVWQLAHNTTRNPSVPPVQKLLLGVNAHINYDLVLALVDVLAPEWEALSDGQRANRYADHCHVNDIIGRTIDAVQDQVLEPATPLLDIVDKILGPLDELLISRLIGSWRETVWQNAIRLLESRDPAEKSRLIGKIEEDTLKIGGFIA